MNILVLAGGLSPERDVSLSSGALIANALMNRGHSVASLAQTSSSLEKKMERSISTMYLTRPQI